MFIPKRWALYVQCSLLQVYLNLQKKRDSSALMKTTPQGGCHETGICFHFAFRHCNQARDRIKPRLRRVKLSYRNLAALLHDARVVFIVSHVTRVLCFAYY